MLDIFQCYPGPFEKSKAGLVRFYGREKMLDGKPHRVVLIMADDDEDDCLFVGDAIKDACPDCTFRNVENGVELLDYLNHRGSYVEAGTAPRPDLILLDLNMPLMDGRRVLEHLKSDPRLRGIPVVILTTSGDAEDVKLCYELGANSYITKQSSFEGILTSMKNLMEYWLEVATLPPNRLPADSDDHGDKS